jgi:hypothetical protein
MAPDMATGCFACSFTDTGRSGIDDGVDKRNVVVVSSLANTGM